MASAPRRPRYFTGQLLTAEDLEAEQSYFLTGRRAHNRLLHGWGVVCGLDVTPSGSGGVVVEAGVAIDGLGREIVVPTPREMPDPRQPIDDRGEPCGEPVDADVITICLAYAERAEGQAEPARFVRESYTLAVRPGPAERRPIRTPAKVALTGSPDDVLRALCDAALCDASDPAEPCVPIATVSGRQGEVEVSPCPRPTLAATDVLLDLILSLLQRVQVLEQLN
jgi:hypothetical protein